ncbi:MAG: acyl-CoA dehydrogenase family protein [Gemmatimonadota bacterium]
MLDTAWPFFDEPHRELFRRVWEFASVRVCDVGDDAAAETRRLVKLFGEAGWLKHAVGEIDVRALCLIRETLAYQHGLADFAFAMQGLGSGPISLFGSDAQKQKYLPPVARGEKIAAFAISEREAGSDIGALRATARREENDWVLAGEKTWISNAGIADHYVVFTRIPDLGEKAYGAFVVDAANVTVTEQLDVIAPHVLGTIKLDDARVSADALIGEAGAGLKIALGTLDVFRTSVAAAALGFARRALDEAVAHTRARTQFGKPLSEFQLTQARIADMALAIDAAALLIYRAAWKKDTGAKRITREAAMAKLFATEQAQKVIDDAVQLHGGMGVVRGATVERLYREIRALRIYEGTSEVQKLIIAAQVYG